MLGGLVLDARSHLGDQRSNATLRGAHRPAHEGPLVGTEELEDVRRLLTETGAAGGRERHGDVPPHVLVWVMHPPAKAGERRVGVRTDELVADRERTETLPHVLLVVAQGWLD